MDHFEGVGGAEGVPCPSGVKTGRHTRYAVGDLQAEKVQEKSKTALASSLGGSCGAQSRNRTSDTGIFSPLLYRLSYLGIVQPVLSDRLFGDAEGARTLDLQRDRLAF